MLIILIPAYNEAAIIHKTLDSVMRQLDQNFKCWIINDGSTDNTAEVVANYCNKMSNFRLINSQQNRGLSGALLYGASFAASTDYIMMLDADDILYPQATQVINAAIQQYAPDALEFDFSSDHCGYAPLFNNLRSSLCRDYYIPAVTKYKQLGLNWQIGFVRWNKVCSMRLWQELSQYYCAGFNSYEDILFCFAYYCFVRTVYRIHQVLSHYTNLPQRMSSSPVNAAILRNIQSIVKTLPFDSTLAMTKFNSLIQKFDRS